MTKKYREGMHLKRGESGVTLLETMVSVTLAATLLALAAPGLIGFALDSKRNTRVSDIVVSLSYARSEAVKRGYPMTLCPSSNGQSCNIDKRWEVGWILFADPNSNGTVDAGESIVRAWQRLDGDGTLRSGRVRLTYQGSGYSLGYNDTLRVCDQRGVLRARSVILMKTGRARVASGASICP